MPANTWRPCRHESYAKAPSDPVSLVELLQLLTLTQSKCRASSRFDQLLNGLNWERPEAECFHEFPGHQAVSILHAPLRCMASHCLAVLAG